MLKLTRQVSDNKSICKYIYLSTYLFISGLFNNAVTSPDMYSLKWYCN